MTGIKNGAWSIAAKTAPTVLKGDANAVYSPACIYEGLRIVRMGAGGASARELDELLGVEKPEGDWLGLERIDKWPYEDYKAHIAAGVWLDRRAEPSTDFVEECHVGEVSITETDLAAPDAGEQITQWISDKTEGLLAPTVDLDADALACVASALYLKDAWSNEFDKNATKRSAFHAEGGDIDADFMTAEVDLPVADTDFGVVVGYPLSNGASMVFALPNEDVALADLIADGSLLDAVRDFCGEVVDVELHVPKFACETTVDGMNMALSRAGFTTAEMPDLAPMTGRAETTASYVHGARIAIDEDGIEAGAYFAMVACAGAMPELWEPPKPRVIVLDRPFAYVIVSRTRQPLFIGTVCSPEADPYAWLPYESESEKGSEDGWIIEDEEIPGICRITLEEGGHTPYAITCGVYGLMVHTAFASDYDEAMGKYEGMKQELEGCARLLDNESFENGEWCGAFIDKWL